MRGNEFLDKMDLIDPAYVEAAATTPQVKRWNWLKKCGTIAACLILLASTCLGTYACTVEVREYNDAMQFFDEYDLSTEGLTRSEIKKVYRDITTKSFSYHKTAEVILDSLSSDQIGGHEILQEDPTPEDLEHLWNYQYFNGKYWVTDPEKLPSIRYSYGNEFTDGTRGKGYVEKYEDNILVWRTYVTDCLIGHPYPVSDGVIVHWQDDFTSTEEIRHVWIAKIDGEGNHLWTRKLENEFQRFEHWEAVLENPDKTYAVITSGDNNYLCLTQFTPWGMEIHSKKIEIGNRRIKMVKPFGDGYAVVLDYDNASEKPNVLIMDYAGNVTSSFSHSEDGIYYCITDMIDFNGKLYLSGYAIPKEGNQNQTTGTRHELHFVSEYLIQNNLWKISGEELTPMIRDNYTAILIACDPSTGKMQDFYSVKGSLGGMLSISKFGTLAWNVESITTTFYSPYTSSFTFGGSCYVFQYVFGPNGNLIGQKKTEKVTSFRR